VNFLVFYKSLYTEQNCFMWNVSEKFLQKIRNHIILSAKKNSMFINGVFLFSLWITKPCTHFVPSVVTGPWPITGIYHVWCVSWSTLLHCRNIVLMERIEIRPTADVFVLNCSRNFTQLCSYKVHNRCITWFHWLILVSFRHELS
jgi:hypothetical protein